jgi:hypothetical protein
LIKSKSGNRLFIFFRQKNIQGAFQKTSAKKTIQAKNNRPTSHFFGFCGLSSMRAGCGHATACGHPAS